MTVGRYFRHLLLGFVLIAAASAVLLISDWSQRRSGAGSIPRIAVLQHASQAALDEGVQGILDALSDGGYVDGKTALIKRFNAENDLATANAIARQITGGDFDLILTSSTLSLQTVANANKDRRIKHVFGIVADPPSAGVGVNRENPAQHPPYMTGMGSLIPVEKVLREAKQLYPGLTKVGLPWNAGKRSHAGHIRYAVGLGGSHRRRVREWDCPRPSGNLFPTPRCIETLALHPNCEGCTRRYEADPLPRAWRDEISPSTAAGPT